MSNNWIIVLDCDEFSCPDKGCHELPEMLKTNLTDFDVSCETAAAPPSKLKQSTSPSLICLCNFSMERLPITIRDVQRRYGKVPLIGIYCEPIRSLTRFDCSGLSILNDFVCCPFGQTDILVRIRRGVYSKTIQPGESSDRGEEPSHSIPGLIGKSKAFLEATHKIQFLSASDAPVLILGETGVGKEVFARAIHYHSKKQGRAFIPVNCGAIPDHLFESELFGHCKGAFTDAVMSQTGLIREAEGGTLFLDEVDTLSPPAQIKFLRFLQDGEYRPIGSTTLMKGNVRILAATNRKLRELVEQGRFREDLFYRLNYLSIEIPSLRDRIEDIPILAAHFIDQHTKKSKTPQKHITSDGIHKLLAYEWPGNLRELEGVICKSMTLHPQRPVMNADSLDLPEDTENSKMTEHGFQFEKDRAMEKFEKTYLLQILVKHRGNISQAARAAGKERRTFRRLLAKHKIKRLHCGNLFQQPNDAALIWDA